MYLEFQTFIIRLRFYTFDINQKEFSLNLFEWPILCHYNKIILNLNQNNK